MTYQRRIFWLINAGWRRHSSCGTLPCPSADLQYTAPIGVERSRDNEKMILNQETCIFSGDNTIDLYLFLQKAEIKQSLCDCHRFLPSPWRLIHLHWLGGQGVYGSSLECNVNLQQCFIGRWTELPSECKREGLLFYFLPFPGDVVCWHRGDGEEEVGCLGWKQQQQQELWRNTECISPCLCCGLWYSSCGSLPLVVVW